MTNILFATFCGALLQELLHWYGLRNWLDETQTQKLLRNKVYWMITGLMIMAAPLAVYFLHVEDRCTLSLRDAFIFGAAAPALLKQAFRAAPKPKNMQIEDTPSSENATSTGEASPHAKNFDSTFEQKIWLDKEAIVPVSQSGQIEPGSFYKRLYNKAIFKNLRVYLGQPF